MVQSNLSLGEVKTKANTYFSSRNYSLVSQTDTQLVYEDGKDVKTIWLILGILFLLIGALLYYFMAKKHTVTVIISELDQGTNVETTTNTKESLTDANAFLASL